jgi:hypothetical protein
MGIPLYSFRPHDIDVRRAVFDLQDDYYQYRTTAAYLEEVWSDYERTPAMRSVMSPVESKTTAAFRVNMGEFVTNHSSYKVPKKSEAVPGLYLSRQFKYGVAVGMAMNHRMLGNDLNTVLVPHIDVIMPDNDLDYRDYAEKVEETGRHAFVKGSSGTQTLADYPPLMRSFVNRLGHDVYDQENHLTYFKIGAGLAYTAYRSFRTIDDLDFHDIIRNR